MELVKYTLSLPAHSHSGGMGGDKVNIPERTLGVFETTAAERAIFMYLVSAPYEEIVSYECNRKGEHSVYGLPIHVKVDLRYEERT